MRKIILLAIFALTVLCSGASFAAEYTVHTVKSGDTLWGIAQTFTGNGTNYMDLAKMNGISNPHLIYVDQRLIISGDSDATKVAKERFKKGTIENPRIYNDAGVGADPFKGSLEEGLHLLGLMSEGDAITSIKETGVSYIKTGDLINMVSGSKGNHKVAYFRVSMNDPQRLIGTLVYEVFIVDKNDNLRMVIVEKNIWCSNWLYKVEAENPTSTVVEVEKEYFPEPELEVAETLEVFEFPEDEKPCCPVEHEPILGVGTWANGIAEGDFAYAEYLLWLKKTVFDCDSPYSWGVGAYGSWEQGESTISSYDWEGYSIGPQIGLKYSGVYMDEEDRQYRLEQWTAKLRLVWEDTKGSNDEGYKMHQESIKLGLYAEYVRELNDKWMALGVVEGWIDVDSSIKSTWSGDEPSERGQIQIAGYGQYQVNEDWAVRFGGGPFYQQWDDMFGLHLRAEARWKNTIMFGPYANLFPFGKTDAYKGIPTSDLQTLGIFVRVEFGEMIRNQDRKIRMQRVKAADDERFGVQSKEM